MTKARKIVVVVNPIAGGREDRKKVAEMAEARFRARGDDVTVSFTGKRGDATEFGRQAVESAADFVVAIGGDGTINEVATALVGSETALAVVPRGSGNGFARSLAIPHSVDAACALVEDVNVRRIDVGKLNERLFFLIAGVGFDAMVGKRFDEHHKRGPLPYFYLGVREFFRYEPQRVRLVLDGRSLDITPFIIAVANGQQYGNNAKIAPHAKLNDGMFDICVVYPPTVRQLLSVFPKLFRGRMHEFKQAEFFKTDSLLIERENADYVNIDGESVPESATLKISILPHSLRVVASPKSPCIVS